MTKKRNSAKKKKDKKPDLIDRYFEPRELYILLTIVLVGFILRLVFVIETESSPFIKELFSDSKIYFDLAKNMVNSGNWIGDSAYYMTPVYPFFLAIIYSIFNNAVEAARIIQVVISSFNIILIYLIARNLFSKNAGYFAAGISAVYSIFIFYSGAILSETLQTFVVNLLIFSLTISNLNLRKKWLLSGLLLGFAALFKANILLLYVGVLIWILFNYKGKEDYKKIAGKIILYFTIGMIIPLSIIAIRNIIVTGDFILVTSNGGINFYIGNNQKSTGVYKLPEKFDITTDLTGKRYAEKVTGKELSASEASNYWFIQGMNFIIENPVQAAELFGTKIFLFFDDSENPQSSIMDPDFFANNYSTVLSLPLPGFYLISILSIAGILLSWKKRKELSLIYIFIICYILSIVIFFVIGRFRVALTPLLIVFAGFAIVKMYEIIKSKNFKKIALPVVIVSLFFVVQGFVTPNFNFDYYEAYLNLGQSRFQEKEYDEALEYLKKSLEYRDYYATYVTIGDVFAAQENLTGALNAYQIALKKNPDYAKAHFAMGSLFLRMGDIKKAFGAFKKSIELDNALDEAYRNIAIIHYINENYKQSLYYFNQYLKLTDNEQAKITVRKDIEEIKKRLNKK